MAWELFMYLSLILILLGMLRRKRKSQLYPLYCGRASPKRIIIVYIYFEKYASLYAFLLSIYLEGLVVEQHRATINSTQLTFDEEWRGVRWVMHECIDAMLSL